MATALIAPTANRTTIIVKSSMPGRVVDGDRGELYATVCTALNYSRYPPALGGSFRRADQPNGALVYEAPIIRNAPLRSGVGLSVLDAMLNGYLAGLITGVFVVALVVLAVIAHRALGREKKRDVSSPISGPETTPKIKASWLHRMRRSSNR